MTLYTIKNKKEIPRYDYKLKKLVGTKKNWKIIYTNPKIGKNIIFYLLEAIKKFRFKYI